ncbi:MAG: GTPase HflX [Candidatus Thermoplasmatota archaeon]
MTGNKQYAILISLTSDTSEMIQLSESLGCNIIKEFIQQRKTPDVNYYIGPGKLEEIKEFIDKSDKTIELAIINGELRPSQWFQLEKKLQMMVYDRIRLILSIFEKRAERREAKLQVKLAQLQYERPYVRELIHRAKAGEHPGYMAGGEYQVDDYYETIKKQIKKIQDELDKIRSNRDLQRQTRYKSGFYLVSLAGYTNAGKSSLLNLLADEDIYVDECLFSTLSTTTRKIPKNTRGRTIPLLLTDTVGFIENLPSWVIDAFHSTLEEIEVADIILLVVDGSEPPDIVERKLKVSLRELQELKVNASIILVFNKKDKIKPNEEEHLIKYLEHAGVIQDKPYVFVSAKNRINIDTLLRVIYNALPNLTRLTLKLPMTENAQKFISELYKISHVLDTRYDDTTEITLECNTKIKDKIIARCHNLNGTAEQK